MTGTIQLKCACGTVHIDIEGDPILAAECCCNSCREANGRLQKLPGAPAVLGPHGQTPYIMYRKDRVRFAAGAEQLRELRLKPDSPTRRVVAACCNTPVFLEFQNGHWLSLYAGLWPAEARPAPQLRTMTSDLPDAGILPADLPNARTQSFGFMWKLLASWVAMGFKTPKVAVAGELQA